MGRYSFLVLTNENETLQAQERPWPQSPARAVRKPSFRTNLPAQKEAKLSQAKPNQPNQSKPSQAKQMKRMPYLRQSQNPNPQTCTPLHSMHEP